MSRPIQKRVGFIEQVVTNLASTPYTLSKPKQSQRVLRLSVATTQTINLPKATGKGGRFRIFLGITASGNKVIRANGSSDFIQGIALIASTGTSGSFATAANTNTITLNGSTTGGVVGTSIELQDVALNQWAVVVHGSATGVAATCFSNT